MSNYHNVVNVIAIVIIIIVILTVKPIIGSLASNNLLAVAARSMMQATVSSAGMKTLLSRIQSKVNYLIFFIITGLVAYPQLTNGSMGSTCIFGIMFTMIVLYTLLRAQTTTNKARLNYFIKHWFCIRFSERLTFPYKFLVFGRWPSNSWLPQILAALAVFMVVSLSFLAYTAISEFTHSISNLKEHPWSVNEEEESFFWYWPMVIFKHVLVAIKKLLVFIWRVVIYTIAVLIIFGIALGVIRYLEAAENAIFSWELLTVTHRESPSPFTLMIKWRCIKNPNYKTPFHFFVYTKSCINHYGLTLTVKETPVMLAPLLNPLEAISGWIRAISISGRISINLICGHLLMGLTGSHYLVLSNLTSVSMTSVLVYFSHFSIVFIELWVPVIQLIIFNTLYLGWSKELNGIRTILPHYLSVHD